MKRKPTKVQTLIFDRARFGVAEAVDWAFRHNFVVTKIDETERSIRLRQRAPSHFNKKSFRTIQFKPGLKAVIGRPKERS